MKMRFYFVLLGICFLMPCTSDATTFPTPNQPFSKYGQIQNVQNYSSNPFWTPDSPYNQRMPVPVYVQGPDVTTADCQRVVSALIESYCASRNNCMDISLTNINPTITVQLANLPGYNFVTPCAAYIQPTFETYKKNNSNAAPTGQAVAFPEALVPNPDVTNQQTNNVGTASPPQKSNWQTEMRAREQELERLQAQNSAGSNQVIKTDFPATFADLSFEQKQQVLASGYAPYKDKSAYKPINIIDNDTTSAQTDESSEKVEEKTEETKQKDTEEKKEQKDTEETGKKNEEHKNQGVPIILKSNQSRNNCGLNSMYIGQNQRFSDATFVYQNTKTYKDAQDKFRYVLFPTYPNNLQTKTNIKDLPGKVFSCDLTGCLHNTIIYSPAGTVYKDKNLSEPSLFTCKLGWNNSSYWEQQSIQECKNADTSLTKINVAGSDTVYQTQQGQYCYKHNE